MAKIAPAFIFFRSRAIFARPVIGQLSLGKLFLPRRGEEDQREAPLLAVITAHFFQTQKIEKLYHGIGIANPKHGVQKFNRHRGKLHLSLFTHGSSLDKQRWTASIKIV